MFIKVHKSYRNIVAICDSNLIGKKFEEGIKQLDIRENFYKGEELSKKKIIELIKFHFKEDSTFSIVGEESIKTCIEAGIINKEGIRKIKGIPFALSLL